MNFEMEDEGDDDEETVATTQCCWFVPMDSSAVQAVTSLSLFPQNSHDLKWGDDIDSQQEDERNGVEESGATTVTVGTVAPIATSPTLLYQDS